MIKYENKVDIINIMLTNGIREVKICEFDYVKDHLLECRAKLRLPKAPESIIMAAFPYRVKENPPENISRYAAVPDYHKVCGEMLQKATEQLRTAYPDNEFEWFSDNSPIPEVAAGVHAGLGKAGRNGLLINDRYGSFVFLGEIVTDLKIEADSVPKSEQKCLDCRQCSKACPTKLCKETCLSSVNQRKNGLSSDEIRRIRESGVVWGCDICSEVCPMNKDKQLTYIDEFAKGYRNEYAPGEDSNGRAYNWRGEGVIKRNYEIINNRSATDKNEK